MHYGFKTRKVVVSPSYATVIRTVKQNHSLYPIPDIPVFALAISDREENTIAELDLNLYVMFGDTPSNERKMQRVADTVNTWLGHDLAEISRVEKARKLADEAEV